MPVERENQSRLTRVLLDGFKTISDLNLEMGQLNILIGANGAGKSNLLSFFSMLNWITAAGQGGLQEFVAKSGGASSLLRDGPDVTERIRAKLCFDTARGANEYQVRLSFASVNTLIFTEESFRFARADLGYVPDWTNVSPGRPESGLGELASSTHPAAKTAAVVQLLLRSCAVFQFHNTSFTSRIRQSWDIEDQTFLKTDAGNLAPFLFRIQQEEPTVYRRITDAIRELAPFFRDFEFAQRRGKLLLQWRERGTDRVFGAHQASDGTLRAMALIALLLQPADWLPAVLLIDEPELGLNPAAISIVAGLLKAASVRSQVVVATQSPLLVDSFEPEDIIAVDRGATADDPFGRRSRYQRLQHAQLTDWLAEYSLGELWQKNVIGARPAQ